MSSSFDPYAELASLFLTDGEPNGGRRDGPTLGLVRDEPLDEPRPQPDLRLASATAGLSAAFSADDALGTPSLTESMPPSIHHAVTAPIEIAIVGHLPVMGGLWLTQYADHVARREGPTALVRIERGQVTMELLRAPGCRGVLERAATIDEALAELAAVASRWVICPSSEASVDGPLAADALTLLTGGDDAATVAAYRIMKNLAERWHIAGWPVPPIGLVVLGSPPERVEEVVEKLDRTTKAFLDVDLAIVGQHQRMDAIESEGRRVFQSADLKGTDRAGDLGVDWGTDWGTDWGVADLCRRIRAHGGRERRAATIASPKRVGPGGAAKLGPKPLGREIPPLALAEPAPAEWVDPFTGAPFANAGASPDSNAHASFRASATANATAAIDAGDATVSPEAPPSTLAEAIPGLTPLATRCPHQPAVELAVDPVGTLHLVIADDALAALRPVEAWVRSHAALLRAAHPELAAPTPIAIDVVTFDAPAVAGLHGAGLHLHLLIATRHGQVHAPLNRSVIES